MDSADRLIDVFDAAKSWGTDAERQRFVAETCGDDAELKQQVLSLLQVHDRATHFLQPKHLITASLPITEKPGDKIGRYRLLQQIGEGGFGVVHMAEQEEPVRRRVALKIIKLGMDTKQVVARFQAEQQALAMMDHPNIAKVFDAGATNTGRPYFVMELVQGTRITDYCDQNCLSTHQRLELFIQVCQAIQHAHQKGIIHRDIKPSNILVTIVDGAPVPKVIDFGIAKATSNQPLTDKTLFTAFEQFIGTPAYMSPEQAEMTSLDIDTRSDIYSLGVLLYELLTGKTPFDAEKHVASGVNEIRRIIREREPPRPSTRLGILNAADLSTVAARRHTEPPRLISSIRGDLDWIVMMCLEKDRARRYETANALAMDLQRHLSNEPVLARSPSRSYRFQKLLRRNKLAFASGSAVALALLATLLTLATSNARIRQALRDRGAALKAARASEQRGREQLFISLKSQAQARRNSRQMGQRSESLAAIAQAARIRPDAELRDHAIAAMAIPDVERGPLWRGGWQPDTRALAYEPLYQRYARIGPDGTISIRSVAEDRELQRLESSSEAKPGHLFKTFRFSPDGRFLAMIYDGKLQIWQWESGNSVLKSAPENCTTLAYSPSGRSVAVEHENWISRFDLNSGEESSRWQPGAGTRAIDFSPDSRRVAVGYYRSNVVSIYSADDGEHVADLPTGAGSSTTVAWHPDGHLLATSGSDPRIQIWDVKEQRKIVTLEGHIQEVTSLVFHAGGDLLTSMSWDGVLGLWQPSPGRQLMRLPLKVLMGSNQAGRWAGVIWPSNYQAQLWGIVPSKEYQTFLNLFGPGESASYEGDISPDGRLLALGTVDGVRLWDVARGREVAWLRMGDTTTALFRADGRELLTCELAGLRRWGIETNAGPEGGLQFGPPHQIALPFAPTRIAKSRDDRTLVVVGDGAGKCAILDLVTEVVRVAEMSHPEASCIALSSDAKRVASSGWHSDRLKVWDGQNGKLIRELEGMLMSRAFFTPDNQEMIVALGTEFIFYDLESLQVSRRMPRDVGLYAGHVAFTADGKLMALEIIPGTIHLKEISSGRIVAKLEDPNGDVSTWMGFTPDGTQLIVAARYAGAIHRWDLRAIRARLKTMNLDWDWPEFSTTVPVTTASSKNQQFMRVEVVGERAAPLKLDPDQKLAH